MKRCEPRQQIFLVGVHRCVFDVTTELVSNVKATQI